ncbi:MAG: hypothetical protein WCD70_16435 [Alphaproteobacteria bacterium]
MPVKHDLAQIAKQIETEAYNRGRDDTIAALSEFIKKFGNGENSKNTYAKQANQAVRRPRNGSDAWHVHEQVKKTPGLTGAQLVAALKSAGTPVKERTVRTSLLRLRDKFITQKGDAWYPI